MRIDTLRQSGIIPDDSLQKSSVTVIGVGGIGSAATECLAKMGIPKLTIYDDDVVDSHNCANQGYFVPEIGYKKVEALGLRLGVGTGCEIDQKFERVNGSTSFDTNVVVSAVDSMKSRYAIWEALKMSTGVNYYVDGRMGARAGYVYFVDLLNEDSMKEYEASLFPDNEAAGEPCTERATIFCGWALGSLIASSVSKTIIGKSEVGEIPSRVLVDMKHFRLHS